MTSMLQSSMDNFKISYRSLSIIWNHWSLPLLRYTLFSMLLVSLLPPRLLLQGFFCRFHPGPSSLSLCTLSLGKCNGAHFFSYLASLMAPSSIPTPQLSFRLPISRNQWVLNKFSWVTQRPLKTQHDHDPPTECSGFPYLYEWHSLHPGLQARNLCVTLHASLPLTPPCLIYRQVLYVNLLNLSNAPTPPHLLYHSSYHFSTQLLKLLPQWAPHLFHPLHSVCSLHQTTVIKCIFDLVIPPPPVPQNLSHCS